jgi:ankyrin repeat protein
MGVCFKGVVELAELLIDEGADVNITNGMGASALIFAAMFNRKEMVELLLENEADKTIQDAKGVTALGHAEMKKASEIVKLLQA